MREPIMLAIWGFMAGVNVATWILEGFDPFLLVGLTLSVLFISANLLLVWGNNNAR